MRQENSYKNFSSSSSQNELAEIQKKLSGLELYDKSLKIAFREILRIVNKSNLEKNEKIELSKRLKKEISEISKSVENVLKLPSYIEWKIKEDGLANDDNNSEKITLESFTISNRDWSFLKWAYWIKRPEDWVFYRWWTAKNIARIILKINPELFDNNTDVDLYISSEKYWEIDLLQEYWATPDWVKVIDEEKLDKSYFEKLFLWNDITVNCLVVSQNEIYISGEAIEGLKTNISEPILQSQNSLFWKKYYLKDWKKIISSTQLYRLFSAIIRKKIDGFKIEKFNLEKENLDIIWMENYYLVIFFKILNWWYSENILEAIMNRYYNLLIQLNLINKWDNIFDFFSQLLDNNRNFNYSWFNSTKKQESENENIQWKIKIFIRHILSSYIDITSRIKDYKTTSNEKIVFRFENNDSIPDFIDSLNIFRNKYKDRLPKN